MITFRQKQFTEYDAMRSLYVELMKRTKNDRQKFPIIDQSSLIPILKGNNIVIERFVISTSFFGKDKYRMYLKIGAKAKMPDQVRLPGRYYDERLGNMSLNIKNGVFSGKAPKEQNNNNNNQKNYSRQSLFSNNNNKKNGPAPWISSEFYPSIDISREVHTLLGDAIKYDKASRSLVLEFDSIDNAINALNILPFGINYKIYLLGD